MMEMVEQDSVKMYKINASLSGKFEKIRERETTITISFLSLIGEVDGG
jgi:hypothetical protein